MDHAFISMEENAINNMMQICATFTVLPCERYCEH